MKDPAVVRWAREQQEWLAAQHEIITRYPTDDVTLESLAFRLEREGWQLRQTLMEIEQHCKF